MLNNWSDEMDLLYFFNSKFLIIVSVFHFVFRNCGGIFCSSCSKRTFFLVHENKGANVRVCNRCYDLMVKARPHQLYVVTSDASTSSLTSKRNNGLMSRKPSEATLNCGGIMSTMFGWKFSLIAWFTCILGRDKSI